jgi:hypothetical protein
VSRHVAKVPMKIGDHYKMIEALILDIGSNKMLLGLDWLAVHNPSMDWINSTVTMDRCPKFCRNYNRSIKRQIEKDKKKKEDQPVKDSNGCSKGVMPDYIKKDYMHLFKERNFDKLLAHSEWDHIIKLDKEAPKRIKADNYHMTVSQLEALEQFLEEELKSGKIRPSKSPYALPTARTSSCSHAGP